jgi:hypothetical protein
LLSLVGCRAAIYYLLVKLINEVENVKQLTEQIKAKFIHKVDQAIRKSGVDSNNIIHTKRIRKPTT